MLTLQVLQTFLKRRILFTGWLISCSISLLYCYNTFDQDHHNLQHRIQTHQKELTGEISARVNQFSLGVMGLRAHLLSMGSEQLNIRQAVKQFISNRELGREFPGSKGFGFIRHVASDEEKDFFLQYSLDKSFPSATKSLSAEKTETDYKFIIEAIEPQITNYQALGLDISSETNRRTAAQTALMTGAATLTAPITLLQDEERPKSGFLLLIPTSIKQIDQDQKHKVAEITGWTYAAFSLADLLSTADLHRDLFEIKIEDVTSQKIATAYISDGFESDDADVTSSTARVLGRSWRISLKPTEKFRDSLETTGKQIFIYLATFSVVSLIWLGVFFIKKKELHIKAIENREFANTRSHLRRWRNMTNSLPQLTWTCARNGDCDFLSARWSQYTGVENSKLLIDGWLKCVHPEDQDTLMKDWCKVVAENGFFQTEFRIRRHDGEYRWFDTRATPIFSDTGELEGWVGSNTDIQETKDIHQALTGMNQKLELEVASRLQEITESQLKTDKILNLVPCFIGYLDRDLNFKFCNHSAKAWFEFSEHELINRNLKDVLPLEIFESIETSFLTALKGARQKVMIQLPSNGHDHGKIGWISLMPDEVNNQVKGLFVTILDVTDVKNAQEQAQANSEAKSKFIATVGHEIRNPLNTIIGASQLLIHENLHPDDAELAENIRHSAKTIRVFLDDLLDLGAAESGKLKIEKVPFSISRILEQTLKQHESTARTKGIVLSHQIQGDRENLTLLGDPVRVSQIIHNLVSNALKFTDSGSVTCLLNIRTVGSVCKINLLIRDTGSGIPSHRLSELFQPYAQLSANDRRNNGGTGLGLSITKSLIERMKGDITVQSRLGEGTEFVVRLEFKILPPRQSDETMAHSAQQNSQPSIKIAFVDDHEMNCKIFNLLFTKRGHQVTTFSKPEEALLCLAKEKFELIVTDLDMPNISGLELIKQIKSGSVNQFTPIAICSGISSESSKEEILSDGACGFIRKPIDPETVEDELIRFVAS